MSGCRWMRGGGCEDEDEDDDDDEKEEEGMKGKLFAGMSVAGHVCMYV